MKVNNFPFGELLKKSWEWTINNRILWIIAFFAGGSGYIVNLSFNSSDFDSLEKFFSNTGVVQEKAAVLFADLGRTIFFFSLISVFAILFVLLGLAMRAALIQANGKINRGEKYSFWNLVKVGFAYLPRLILLCVLWSIPNIILGILFLWGFSLSFGAKQNAAGMILLICVALVGLAYNFILWLVRHNAYCFLVLENKKAWESLKSSWQLMCKNFLVLVVAGLIEIGLGMLIGFGLIMILIAVALPFVILGAVLMFAVGSIGILIPVVLGAAAALAVLAILRGATNFYFNTFLTNIYWELKK